MVNVGRHERINWPQELGERVMQFKDVNFKLYVMQSLVNAGHLRSELRAAEELAMNRKGVREGALDAFRKLDLPVDLLATVEKVSVAAGDDVLECISPEWDGEDELFHVRTLDDIGLLPNLKHAVFIYLFDNQLDFSPLLKAPKLEKVRVTRPLSPELTEALVARDVVVDAR